jgi:hypothetical protein
MQSSLKGLRPRFLSDLIRIGNPFDGGYVINERAILSSRYLVSFGVNDDWSFEADFLAHKPGLKIFCFDHSVSRQVFRKKLQDNVNETFSLRFLLSFLSLNIRGVRQRISNLRDAARLHSRFSAFFTGKNVRFIQKGLSNERDQQFVTLDDVFQMIPQQERLENSVFLKMDIEQSEYRVLPTLEKYEKYINGMVVEFHDLDILWSNFVDLMSTLRNCFEITHVHGNNFGGLIPDSQTPKVLEITFVKKALISESQRPDEEVIYPVPELDRPNDPYKKDYPLYF